MLANLMEKVKPYYNYILVIIVVSILAALWQIYMLEQQYTPLKIHYPGQAAALSIPSGEVIGSKNSMKYFLPWCGTVKQIKPENQVMFASAEEARASGYTPAANCKGLK